MKKKYIFIFLVILIFVIISFLNQFYGWFITSKQSFNVTYVSLRFDDGYKSQLNAYYLLKEYNMTGSMYVVISYVGKEGYLNWSDIEMISDTMEIGSHTRTHADLRNFPKLNEEIEGSYMDLSEKGFNVSTFVYPYGNYDLEAVKVVRKYYKCASTQEVGVNTRDSNLYLLNDFTFRNRNSIKEISRVIKNNTWVILTLHNIGNSYENAPRYIKDNSVSVEFFEEILRYLKENNIKVITISEGCDILTESQKAKRLK